MWPPCDFATLSNTAVPTISKQIQTNNPSTGRVVPLEIAGEGRVIPVMGGMMITSRQHGRHVLHLRREPEGILFWYISSAAWDTAGSESRLHTASTLSSLIQKSMNWLHLKWFGRKDNLLHIKSYKLPFIHTAIVDDFIPLQCVSCNHGDFKFQLDKNCSLLPFPPPPPSLPQ